MKKKPKLKTYIVARDQYNRHGFGDCELLVEMYKARTLDELALKLSPSIESWLKDWADDPEEKEKVPSPWKYLCNDNGDGCDYLVVKELRKGKLRDVNMTPRK